MPRRRTAEAQTDSGLPQDALLVGTALRQARLHAFDAAPAVTALQVAGTLGVLAFSLRPLIDGEAAGRGQDVVDRTRSWLLHGLTGRLWLRTRCPDAVDCVLDAALAVSAGRTTHGTAVEAAACVATFLAPGTGLVAVAGVLSG